MHFQGSLGKIYKFAEVYDLEERNLRAGRNPHKVYSSWEYSKYLMIPAKPDCTCHLGIVFNETHEPSNSISHLCVS